MKSIVVFGATGAQGSSVVSHVLAKGGVDVYGVTRAVGEKTEKQEAPWKANPHWKGWRVGDQDKPETLAAAVAGVDSVFIVTNFWEHLDGAREERQGKAAIDAAVAAGAKQIIFSGLTSPMKLAGIERVHHFEHKFNLEEYLFSDACAAVAFRTSVRMSMYYENHMSFFPPRKGEDGSYSITLPAGDKPVKIGAVADYGGVVAEAVARPADFHLRRPNAVRDFITMEQVAAAMSDALGVKVTYNAVPTAVFAGFGFPGADDLAQMFAFYQVWAWDAEDELGKASNPGAKTFAEWVSQPSVVATLRKNMGL